MSPTEMANNNSGFPRMKTSSHPLGKLYSLIKVHFKIFHCVSTPSQVSHRQNRGGAVHALHGSSVSYLFSGVRTTSFGNPKQDSFPNGNHVGKLFL